MLADLATAEISGRSLARNMVVVGILLTPSPLSRVVPAAAVFEEGTSTDDFFDVATVDLTSEFDFRLLLAALTKLYEPLTALFSVAMPRVVVFLKPVVLVPTGL